MIDDPTLVPQSQFQDDQNFEIDIEVLYNDFIKTIDDARSFVNITDSNNSDVLNKKFTVASFSGKTGITSSLKPEQTPQESRCHAFYRLIGFPVVGNDSLIYNPGYDILFIKNRQMDIKAKVEIANNPLNGFQSLSFDRESYSNNFDKIFSNNTSIEASTLALSSINIRLFGESFVKNKLSIENPFLSSNQSYSIATNSKVGNHIDIDVFDYRDSNGKSVEQSTSLKQRKHIIKPFIVDAKVDISASAAKKVGIPFLPDDSFLKITETISVKRPLLEKIILDRFDVRSDTSTVGTEVSKAIEFIKSVNGIQDENLVNQISSGDLYKASDKKQFAKYLHIIQAMIKKLVKSLNIIDITQSEYYWLPAPSTTGTEGGCTVQPVIQGLPENLTTENDIAIITAKLNSLINDIDAEAAAADATPDVGSYAFGKFTVTFDSSTSSGLGDEKAKTLAGLNELRVQELNLANDALRTIEIIMGEFSGLGLCDIIAIMASLYIMKKENLLGFLDADSYLRAFIHPKINLDDVTQPTIQTALDDLTLTVNSFYNIMDKVFLDIRNNNR